MTPAVVRQRAAAGASALSAKDLGKVRRNRGRPEVGRFGEVIPDGGRDADMDLLRFGGRIGRRSLDIALYVKRDVIGFKNIVERRDGGGGTII